MSNDANWKKAGVMKFFIDLCLVEANNKNFSGCSLKKEAWERIMVAFKEKKNIDVTQKQMKNKWDYLKRKYQTWVSIVGRTGNTYYDPVTKTINWTDEKWDEEIKLNPDVKQFRYKSLEFPDELRDIFEGMLATGKDACGPSKEGFPLDDMTCNIQTPINLDENEDCTDPFDGKVKQEVKRRKRSSTSEKIDDVESQLLSAIKTLENSKGPSMQECNKLLDEMKTLDATDPLYLAATGIFCENESYRKQWIELNEKPEALRKNWISMIAKKLQLL